MQEFRPASVIAADDDLATSLRAGDPEAITALVRRYGAAVIAGVTSSVGGDDAEHAAVDVFVTAATDVGLAPGDDFAPWLAALAAERAGAVDEQRWTAAMATSAVDVEMSDVLRAHHLEGVELADDAARHELRLQRRLAHLGDTDAIHQVLADPVVWTTVDDPFVDDVLAALGHTAEPHLAADAGDLEIETPTGPTAVTRLLRPVLLGLGGAVLVLFAAIVGLSALSGTPTAPNYSVELVPTGVLADVEGGEITVTERDAGLEIELDAPTLPRRAGTTFYEGRLVLSDGAELSTGTFAEADGVTLWAGADLSEATAFQVVAGDRDDVELADVVLKADLPAP